MSGIRARSVHTAFFPLLREPPTVDGRIWLKMFVSLNRDGEDLAEDAITDSVGRLLGAQRRRGESNSGYTSQTSAGPWVGDTTALFLTSRVYLSPDEREAYVSDAVGSRGPASISRLLRSSGGPRRTRSGRNG